MADHFTDGPESGDVDYKQSNCAPMQLQKWRKSDPVAWNFRIAPNVRPSYRPKWRKCLKRIELALNSNESRQMQLTQLQQRLGWVAWVQVRSVTENRTKGDARHQRGNGCCNYAIIVAESLESPLENWKVFAMELTGFHVSHNPSSSHYSRVRVSNEISRHFWTGFVVFWIGIFRKEFYQKFQKLFGTTCCFARVEWNWQQSKCQIRIYVILSPEYPLVLGFDFHFSASITVWNGKSFEEKAFHWFISRFCIIQGFDVFSGKQFSPGMNISRGTRNLSRKLNHKGWLGDFYEFLHSVKINML